MDYACMGIYVHICYTVISFCSVPAFDHNLLMTTGCYTQVSAYVSVTRYRNKVVMYYYRTFTFGWRGSWR